MTQTREETLEALPEMSRRHPNWRFGQMVSNISLWAGNADQQGIWDVEDEQFLAALRKHLAGAPPGRQG